MCNNYKKLKEILERIVIIIETIAAHNTIKGLTTDLDLLKYLLDSIKKPSCCFIKKLNKLAKEFISVYDEQPDNPDIKKLQDLYEQMIKVYVDFNGRRGVSVTLIHSVGSSDIRYI